MNTRLGLPYILIALFASLTALGAFIQIPLYPVPITVQTLFVYLSGDLLGAKRGAVSQLIFLMIGLSGIPVFSHGGGIGYILQPTFGYLAAFPMASWTIGTVIRKKKLLRKWQAVLIANFFGMMIIFIVGIGYLYINFNYIINKHISLHYVILSGLIIFLPGEFIKIILATSLHHRLDGFLSHIKHDEISG